MVRCSCYASTDEPRALVRAPRANRAPSLANCREQVAGDDVLARLGLLALACARGGSVGHLPAGLEVDTFDGWGWVGVVPFRMTDVGPKGLNWLPGLSSFAEINVRTYAKRGSKAGVFFFSLDAESRLAVEAGRGVFHLPYLHARMSCRREGEAVQYASERTDRRAPSALFRARYEPAGPVFEAERDGLERWLTERYCLFAVDHRRRLLLGEVHHAPWPLQRGRVEIVANTMGAGFGLPLAGPPAVVHYAKELDVLVWRFIAA